jgi:hypothetical protein
MAVPKFHILYNQLLVFQPQGGRVRKLYCGEYVSTRRTSVINRAYHPGFEDYTRSKLATEAASLPPYLLSHLALALGHAAQNVARFLNASISWVVAGVHKSFGVFADR